MNPKTPEERQAIWGAITTEERLKATADRMSAVAYAQRTNLSIAVAFTKGSPIYDLVERIKIFHGYPVGGAINERTGRVDFQYTKEHGFYKWRDEESIAECANEVCRSILTTVLLSEDPELLAFIKRAVTNSRHTSYASAKLSRKFFESLDRYLTASKETRDSEKVEIAVKALGALTEEQKRMLMAKEMPDQAERGVASLQTAA